MPATNLNDLLARADTQGQRPEESATPEKSDDRGAMAALSALTGQLRMAAEASSGLAAAIRAAEAALRAADPSTALSGAAKGRDGGGRLAAEKGSGGGKEIPTAKVVIPTAKPFKTDDDKDKPGKPAAAAAGGGLLGKLGSMATAAAAIAAIPAAVAGLSLAVQPFVAAFNPQAIVRFNYAMDSLAATVGYALEPVMNAFTDTVRYAAGALRPVFDALRPVVARLTSLFSSIAQEGLGALGEVLTGLIPILDSVVGAFSGLGPAMQSLSEAFRAYGNAVAALAPLIGPALAAVLKTTIDNLRIFARGLEVFYRLVSAVASTFAPIIGDLDTSSDALVNSFDEAARAVVVFTARLATFLGATEFVENMAKAFAPREEKGGAGRAAAPKDFKTGGIEDVFKEINLRAAQAQTGGMPSKDQQRDEWAKGTLEEIRKVQANTFNLPKKMDELITKISELVSLPRQVQRDAGRYALESTLGPLARLFRGRQAEGI